MVTLQIYRNNSQIKVSVIRRDGRIKEMTIRGEIAWAFVNIEKGTIGINLDLFKNKVRFFLPQIFLHEMLHLLFPSFEVTNLVHKIHKKSHWLVC